MQQFSGFGLKELTIGELVRLCIHESVYFHGQQRSDIIPEHTWDVNYSALGCELLLDYAEIDFDEQLDDLDVGFGL